MEKVKVYTKMTTIPTYEPSEPNRLPMFFDKRIYQGTSGKVYPYSVTEKISDTKTDKEYNAVYLENDYLLVMLLPEIGGKVHRILDKTNNYDCVYYNEVIKPALVGLAGPWTMGGIEFNFPQHHRPSTFEKADFYTEENPDGSAVVHMSEIDKMHHIKGMASFKLYPDKAYLEVTGQIYNTTETTRTFLWWANPAVPANDYTQTIFPPDVHTVMNHGKREISKFPIATGVYYNVDYSEGVDISRFKNIPVPTSYMACHSDFDFIGNYDHNMQTGMLHIADHHISSGKRQWTWGNGDFGNAWHRALTDENGAYTELMTGVFTDNQPDFTFLAPYEEKTFTQYFMPYKNIGAVKNATIDAAVNLEVENGRARVRVYMTSAAEVLIELTRKSEKYISDMVILSPADTYEKFADIDDEDELTVTVSDAEGKILVSYSPVLDKREKTPEPAQAAKKPEEIYSLEELYLTALHLEQYRHAIYSPIPYYLEGLKRDPSDIRLNNGYGKLLYKMGLFEESEKYFLAAIKKSTMMNPNPYDCEPYYNLGLAYKEQGKLDEAYDAFYKSVWSSAMQDCGFYQLACIASMRNDFNAAIEFTEKSLVKGYHNLKARNLRTALLRLSGRTDEAEAFARETLKIDSMSYGARYELYRATNDFKVLNTLTTIMQDNLQSYIELSVKYSEAGLLDEAAKVLALISQSGKRMLHYYTAYYSNSAIELDIAKKCTEDYGFSNTLHDIHVLEYAIKNSPDDARAPYDLGNILYDKGQWQRAIELWEKSIQIEDGHADVYRNLALAYYNRLHDSEKAVLYMEKANMLAPGDARIFYELDCLYKETNYPILKRANAMVANMDLVSSRDDLYTELITIANTLGKYDRALKFIDIHTFHPWEGGEGKITSQYRYAHIGLAKKAIAESDIEEAVNHLTAALTYPENLGEGKLYGSLDNDIYYLLGCAYENTDKIKSIEYFGLASNGKIELDSETSDFKCEMFFYRALAFAKLGHEKTAKGMYNKLINYSEEHEDDSCEIDYFAVSLPDFLIFEADLNKKNKIRCAYAAALGYLGLGDTDTALEYIDKGLGLDNASRELSELKRLFIKNEEDEVKEIKRNYIWGK